jgi:hypothetical protein
MTLESFRGGVGIIGFLPVTGPHLPSDLIVSSWFPGGARDMGGGLRQLPPSKEWQHWLVSARVYTTRLAPSEGPPQHVAELQEWRFPANRLHVSSGGRLHRAPCHWQRVRASAQRWLPRRKPHHACSLAIENDSTPRPRVGRASVRSTSHPQSAAHLHLAFSAFVHHLCSGVSNQRRTVPRTGTFCE